MFIELHLGLHAVSRLYKLYDTSETRVIIAIFQSNTCYFIPFWLFLEETTNWTNLTRFNKIAIQGTPQMAVDKEAICLSGVYSYYPKCNFPLFYV